MSKWTPTSLLDACEELLASNLSTVRIRTLGNSGDDAYAHYSVSPSGRRAPGQPFTIVIDPVRAGAIPAVLHELLHMVLHDSLLSFGSSLDETIVRRLEEKLWQRHFPVKRVRRWRSLLRKIQEQSDE